MMHACVNARLAAHLHLRTPPASHHISRSHLHQRGTSCSSSATDISREFISWGNVT